MRIAFFSDIHANLEAFEACLASLIGSPVDKVVILGDIVGYGADPVACVELAQDACAKGAVAIIGNHDEAILASRFKLNSIAAAAIDWTKAVLRQEHKTFLASLPLSVMDEDRLYVHASAKAPETYPYIHNVQAGSDSLRATTAFLTVCGHVHVPNLFNISTTGKVMGFTPDAGMPIPLSANRRWLAVMGAVGQPRDGNPAAAYGVYDTETKELSFVRVPYDIETAAAKIRRAGLPDTLWKRLSIGR